MSRSRNRGRRRGGNRQAQGNSNQSTGEQRQSQSQGGQGQSGRGRRRRRGGARSTAGSGFWGDADELPEARRGLRISEQPDAVVRSLGPPPLPGREQIAGHYFLAIYQRAVMTAGALAASGGLIETEALAREFEDSDDDD